LKNRRKIIGGFYANPSDPSARDPNPATNGTVLSGDLGSLGWSAAVVTSTGVTDQPNTVLDGFAVRDARGHAIKNDASKPRLTPVSPPGPLSHP
jgi:hypothetical protein